jgi:hypothetical protein
VVRRRVHTRYGWRIRRKRGSEGTCPVPVARGALPSGLAP